MVATATMVYNGEESFTSPFGSEPEFSILSSDARDERGSTFSIVFLLLLFILLLLSVDKMNFG